MMCAADQEKENLSANAQHINSRTASAVESVLGFTLSRSSGTLSSAREFVLTVFQILMDRAKLWKAGNQKRSARCSRSLSILRKSGYLAHTGNGCDPW